MKYLISAIVAVLIATPVLGFAEIDHAQMDVNDGWLEGYVDVARDSERDLKVTLFIPELGIRARQGPLETSQDHYTLFFDEELPANTDGVYWVKVTVANENGHTSVYRPIYLG